MRPPLMSNVRSHMRAPKHWFEYEEDWRSSPMAFWVHVEQDGKHWRDLAQYAPPSPRPVVHKGYPVLCVEFEDVVLRFSSQEQVHEFIRVLSLKPLPTSRRLSEVRDTGAGPNSHWLSRLPARLKSPKVRSRVVEGLTQVLAENGT